MMQTTATQGLTAEETASYREHGFVVRRELFSASQIEDFDRRFLDVVEGRVEKTPLMQVMRDVMVVKGAVTAETTVHAVNKLFNFENDPVLNAYTADATLLACVRSLLGPVVHSVSTNVFNKPPDVDGRHPMHQDLRYFRARPADLIVGTWTAVYPARRETGCLSILPDSHRRGELEHALPDWNYVNHGFYAVKDVDWSERVHIELEPGDTLLFHPLLIHGSGHNRSRQFRRAISAHYISDEARAPDGREWRDRPTIRRYG
ncbi:MAG: phytanoyl-CoA dioxygenase family protein [Pseudomonadales bacterium]